MSAKSKKISIPENILKTWWWRRVVFVAFDEESHTTHWKRYVPEHPSHGFSIEWHRWHTKEELLAFRYELLRRQAFPELPDYASLPIWMLPRILGVITPEPERSPCSMFSPKAPDNYASLGDWMWDLTASDESLCRYFLLRINEERRKVGLPCTNDPFSNLDGNTRKLDSKRRGERNRQVSWLAVEAFDIQKHKIRQLTDGERSRLSKAKREIAVFESGMREALNIIKERIPEEGKKNMEFNLVHRFVRENFEQLMVSRLKKD